MSMRLIGPVYLVGGQDFNRVHLDWQANDANVYLVDTRDTFVLIDCGCGESLPGILANVRDMGFDVEDISHVLLTHAHFPHAGAAGDLQKMQVEVMASSFAARAVQAGDMRTASFNYQHEFPPCDRELSVIEDGESLEVGAVTLHAHSTPGHSPGHMAYSLMEDSQRILFSGDAVRSPQLRSRRDRFGFDSDDRLECLINLLEEPSDVIYPGHGPFCLSDGQTWVQKELEKELQAREGEAPSEMPATGAQD